MPDPTTIALDFDGVVADSMPTQERLWREALQRVGAECGDVSQLIRSLWRGRAGERIFAETRLSPEQRQEARAIKNELWHAVSPSIPLVPGAAAAIETLATRYLLSIATTATESYVRSVLSRDGLVEHFLCIVTDQHVAEPKPAPDMLRLISQRTGADPAHLLMIGDTAADYEMARSFGCRFLLLDVYRRHHLSDREVFVGHDWAGILDELSQTEGPQSALPARS